jgi:hypothetical protein
LGLATFDQDVPFQCTVKVLHVAEQLDPTAQALVDDDALTALSSPAMAVGASLGATRAPQDAACAADPGISVDPAAKAKADAMTNRVFNLAQLTAVSPHV